MCDNWKKDYSNQHSCDGIVLDSGNGEYIVKGHVNTKTPNANILFWAANPATYTGSFTGSGLPYPSADVAYENTPNRGAVKSEGGHFRFRVRYPNAYYMGLGSVYVEPCVFIKVCEEGGDNKVHRIRLGNGIPFRMLTYPPSLPQTAPRQNALFYAGRETLPIRTQEDILRASAYPSENKMPKNFWGMAVPHE